MSASKTAEGGAATLTALLAHQAAVAGERTAYFFNDEPRTFGRLWSDVEAFAGALVRHDVQSGSRVVLALPNGHEFFTALYGAQRAGAIAVPIFPDVPAARVIEMAHLCGAQHIVIPIDTPPQELAWWRSNADALHILTGHAHADETVTLPEIRSEDVAYIQYTSGSTGDPKGVQLSHDNLLTNVRQMIAGMEIAPQDRFVSWLPTYHDMGLILMTMVPFYLAAPLYLLPASLRDTRPWLDAITRHRGTFTASPDFGYRLCLRQAAAAGDRDVYDLTSLRVALNAAEPVRSTTIDNFHAAFGLENVMVAAYGLAEATVGVSMWKPSTANRIDNRGAVSVGRPFPEVVVRILDEHDRLLPTGETGHIVVTTPAATRGYFRNRTATEALFAGPDTVRTGDIGYLDDDGFVYILGRAKDVIIQAGRSIHAQEVEEVVNRIAGVRYSAAIGVDRGGAEGEQVIVLAEIRLKDLPDDEAKKSCAIAITAAIRDRFGVGPGRVHLVAPGTIPMTPNGKLRRSDLKGQYLAGALQAELLYPAISSPAAKMQ